MNQVIQLSQSQFETFLRRLNRQEKMVAKLLEKEGEPQYGSDEWWEWSDRQALKEVEKGEYYELKDKEELDGFFNNIIKDKSNRKYDHKVRQSR